MPTTLQELHDLLKNNEPDDTGYNGPKLWLSSMNVFVKGQKWSITFTSDKGYVDIVTNVRCGYGLNIRTRWCPLASPKGHHCYKIFNIL